MSTPRVFSASGVPLDLKGGDLVHAQWSHLAELGVPWRMISRTQSFDLSGPRMRAQTARAELEALLPQIMPLATALADGQFQREAIRAWVESLDARDPRQMAQITRLLGGRDVGQRETWEWLLRDRSRPLWKEPWLSLYANWYRDMEATLMLRGADHRIVLWTDEDGETLARRLAGILHTHVAEQPFPAVLRGDYEARLDHLVPRDPGLPLWAFLQATTISGNWTPTRILRLFEAGDAEDVVVIVDGVPIPRATMEYQAALVANATGTSMQQRGGYSRDVQAERRLAAAQRAQELLEQTSFHDVRVVVGVAASSPAELSRAIAAVRDAGGSQLHLRVIPGKQHVLVRMGGVTPSSLISTPIAPQRIPATHAAYLFPLGFRRPAATDGVPWFHVDGPLRSQVPVFLDPMRARQAGHVVIVGVTGSGKTVLLNALALRLMALGNAQVMVIEPQGHAKRLVDAAAMGGVRNVVSAHESINIFDLGVTGDEHGRPPALAAQVSLVIGLLSILLGTEYVDEDGKTRIRSKEWTDLERGYLDVAIAALYAPWRADLRLMPPDATPRMDALVRQLRTFTEATAHEIARTLELAFVDGTAAAMFNRPTSLRFDFRPDVLAYDLSQITDPRLALLALVKTFNGINGYVRDRMRSRERQLWVIIDEFGYMLSGSPMLAGWIANAATTWRTFGAAIVAADQNATTWLGTADKAAPAALGRFFSNCPTKLLLRQRPEDVAQLAEHLPALTAQHLRRIETQGVGQLTAVQSRTDGSGDEVLTGVVLLHPTEQRMFLGS